MTTRTDGDNDRMRELDRTVRALHAEAVDHVSRRTLQQLRTRRSIATRTPPARATRALGWTIATACAAVFAVALGLRFDRDGASTPADAQLAATADPSAAEGGYDDALASYDEDPDLYLWLASGDAQPLAME
jgi:anti-sigma-K factor RskA